MLKSIQTAEMSIVYTSCSCFIIYTVNLKVPKKQMLTWKKMGAYSGSTKEEISTNNWKIYFFNIKRINCVLGSWYNRLLIRATQWYRNEQFLRLTTWIIFRRWRGDLHYGNARVCCLSNEGVSISKRSLGCSILFADE